MSLLRALFCHGKFHRIYFVINKNRWTDKSFVCRRRCCFETWSLSRSRRKRRRTIIQNRKLLSQATSWKHSRDIIRKFTAQECLKESRPTLLCSIYRHRFKKHHIPQNTRGNNFRLNFFYLNLNELNIKTHTEEVGRKEGKFPFLLSHCEFVEWTSCCKHFIVHRTEEMKIQFFYFDNRNRSFPCL